MENENTHWAENIIVVDADYVDNVAFNLTVNFERMLGRRIQKADIAHWIDCIALDGGLREGENEVQVLLIHEKDKKTLENFQPSTYAGELDGQAFKDHLGEFSISALEVEPIVSKVQFINDVVGAASIQKKVKRIMIIPNGEDGVTYNQLRGALQHVEDENKRITMFAMQPMPGGNFKQEILGYSLLAALGIKSDELNNI